MPHGEDDKNYDWRGQVVRPGQEDEAEEQRKLDELAQRLQKLAGQPGKLVPEPVQNQHSGEMVMRISEQTAEPDWCDARMRAVALEIALKHAIAQPDVLSPAAILGHAGEFFLFIAGEGR
jgi:hypothetical protein